MLPQCGAQRRGLFLRVFLFPRTVVFACHGLDRVRYDVAVFFLGVFFPARSWSRAMVSTAADSRLGVDTQIERDAHRMFQIARLCTCMQYCLTGE